MNNDTKSYIKARTNSYVPLHRESITRRIL